MSVGDGTTVGVAVGTRIATGIEVSVGAGVVVDVGGVVRVAVGVGPGCVQANSPALTIPHAATITTYQKARRNVNLVNAD